MTDAFSKKLIGSGKGASGDPGEGDGGVGVITRTPTKSKQKVKRPSFYVVVVHNDPITPRGFVVEVLRRYFSKEEPEATRIMMLAHNFGVGVVAKYPHEIAETKATQVNEVCRLAGYPLFFSCEKEE